MFKKKVGKIDIILDDGGHRYIDQITSIESIVSNVRHNGLIVIEDTHTSYMDGFGDKNIPLLITLKTKLTKLIINLIG